MTHQIVLTDADNTLWDTDAVFKNAQLSMLDVLETASSKQILEKDRLAFVRRYDQALAASHHAHFRYPPVMLASALLLALSGMGVSEATDSVISGRDSARPLNGDIVALALDKYLAMLAEIPALLPTVLEGMLEANGAGLTVYVLTEGKIERQKSILSHYGLAKFCAGVFEITKTQAQFKRLRQRFAPDKVVVVGDQPDRDIAPARAAGCAAVLVPSRFIPSWNDAAHSPEANFVATSYQQAIKWAIEN